MLGWPLPVEPKKDDGNEELEGTATTKELTAGATDSGLRRRKTTGGVQKVESIEHWKTLQQVLRLMQRKKLYLCVHEN